MTYAFDNIDDLLLNDVFPGKQDGFFVDCAAFNGVRYSNTKLLEEKGWSGLCIEDNPDLMPSLQHNRSCTCVNACVTCDGRRVEFVKAGLFGGIVENSDDLLKDCQNGKESIWVESLTIGSLLRTHSVPAHLDLLSLDVEGSEMEVLSSFPFDEFMVDTIVIEHTHIDSDEAHKLLESRGFGKIHETDWDFVYRTL